MTSTIIPQQLAATVVVAASDSLETWRASWSDALGRYLICDGAADEAEIQDAIDVLPAGGGKVVLLDGTFTTAAAITITVSSVTLEGQGESTLITCPTDNEQTIDVYGDGGHIHGVEVRNLQLKQTSGAGTASTLRVRYADYCIFDRIFVTESRYDGLLIFTDALGCMVSNCYVAACLDDGININACTYCTVTGCVITGVTNDGIHIVGDCNHNTVTGNTSRGNGGDGIYLDQCQYNTVSANVCSGNTGDGIKLAGGAGDGTEDCIIDGNICEGNVFGINVNTANCTRNVISNNTISQNSSYGMNVISHHQNIVGNTFHSNTTYGIYCIGDECTASENHLYDEVTAIYWYADRGLVSNNNIYSPSANGIRVDRDQNTIVGNYIEGAGSNAAIYLYSGADENVVVGNSIYNCSAAGIDLYNSDYNVVVGNRVNGVGGGAYRAVYERGTSDYNIITNNILVGAGGSLSYVGVHSVLFDRHTETFLDINVVTTNFVGSWAGTGAEQVISPGDPGWAAQPDVKRNLTVTCTNNAAPSGNVVIVGVNAKGQGITETFTIVPGGTATGNEAFATITTVTIPATVTAADTVDVGIGSKLGLSNMMVASIYKVTRTTGGAPGATAADYSAATDITKDYTYHTVDVATGAGIVAGDCYVINYRTNLNILN